MRSTWRHLRVDLVLADPAHPARLRQATAEAQALGVPLEIALRISPDSADGELAALRRLLDALRPNVCRWLVFPAKEMFRGGSPLREVIEPARTHLAGYGDAALVSGTDADFIFLARSLPPLELVDALTFAITPQVHAFDNASIVETLATEGAAVRSASALAAGKPVYVSPVTLENAPQPIRHRRDPAHPARRAAAAGRSAADVAVCGVLGDRQCPQPGSERRGGHHLLRDDRLARGDGDGTAARPYPTSSGRSPAPSSRSITFWPTSASLPAARCWPAGPAMRWR